ncbi:MAG: lipopolysaccharide heptosyltransferase II [Candidatus Omnitrophica bacterium]|nr:lipopolysaccharide heptosyltransferase II [Candidatus Omnitrophota bacterium]MBU1853816.1 lipopolysaccharide heptosyltransferase II [Candidatus Omnitrophota bacterium]
MDISKIKKILIVRTDRIGDVVLSTPVITATREAFPEAYIAVMVSPKTKEIVTGNPFLNGVIVYDKKFKHRGIFKAVAFSGWLRSKGFDLALILHSTARVNLICFLARIPKRIGYARGKMDFLLTDKLEYTKRLGEKHESEYSLDILRSIGINVTPSPLVMPVKKSDEENMDNLLKECGLAKGERFIVLHPGASCVSKMWPQKNFAELGDILIGRFGVKCVLISSPDQIEIGKKVRDLMKDKPLFLCGRTSLGELASLFKRASLFISNDSGPVHIASAVGTPLISIFGRNEKGLSPTRWKALGDKSVVLHKEVGCKECLAHNCKKGFLCLRSVTVEEVVEKAGELLNEKAGK